ncbi:hypothetical protein ABZ349_17405 [Streptomyces niveus]|uniref:hypothetical protein n=1 Tax=Streptomyces niveus TaxID=193462 RepID=UPI0033D36FC3
MHPQTLSLCTVTPDGPLISLHNQLHPPWTIQMARAQIAGSTTKVATLYLLRRGDGGCGWGGTRGGTVGIGGGTTCPGTVGGCGSPP